MAESNKRYCPKCRKTFADTNFYTYKDGTKAELCKYCLTMHVDNWDASTYEWILKDFDVPYIPSKWNSLRERAVAKNPKKPLTGISVLGKYLSSMKIKPWGQYGYADTAALCQKQDEDAALLGTPREQMEEKLKNMEIAFENGEITEAQLQTYKEVYAEPQNPDYGTPEIYGVPEQSNNSFVENSPFEQVEIIDIGADLPQEDKIYLAMKWGRLYTAAEWVQLEQQYKSFTDSFDIHDPARIDTLKFICKTSLKGDPDSYQKLARVYDAQMKAGKFTEAQKKEDKGTEFSGYGQIVAFCEKEGGFIPRLETHTDRDIADKDLHDMKSWVRDLIEQDPMVFKQIEQYIKKRENADEQERDKLAAMAQGEEYYTVTDEDMTAYNASIDEQMEDDWA